MHRYVFVAGILFFFLAMMPPSVPALAITAKDKMATCKFGADDQKLQGKARAAFLKKCMSNRNDPRGPATPERAAAPGASPKP
jgi:psiF repeat